MSLLSNPGKAKGYGISMKKCGIKRNKNQGLCGIFKKRKKTVQIVKVWWGSTVVEALACHAKNMGLIPNMSRICEEIAWCADCDVAGILQILCHI